MSCVTCCAVLLEPQLLDIMIVQFRNEKGSNHGSIPITIDCNVVAFIVFEEGLHQPIKCSKHYTKATTLHQQGAVVTQCGSGIRSWQACHKFELSTTAPPTLPFKERSRNPVPSCKHHANRLFLRWWSFGLSWRDDGHVHGTRNLLGRAATAGSDVVQSGRPIFDDFFQHLWPYIGNNTANVVFQMVKRLWLIRIDQ
ncbi:hypothetical protein TNCV_429531 [Trichonephila clavipes]|nr:hypothetical protein TNCV_429531 [Trichonephila clavipes]